MGRRNSPWRGTSGPSRRPGNDWSLAASLPRARRPRARRRLAAKQGTHQRGRIMSSAPRRSNRSFVWMAILAVLIAVGGYAAWKYGARPKPVDMVAVLRLNNRGVGEMLQF